MDTVVYDKPEVSIDLVKAVDSDKIYLNWTIVRWNSPVTDYYLSYRTDSQDAWEYFIHVFYTFSSKLESDQYSCNW